MVYIFIIAFLKEGLKNENSYFNFYDLWNGVRFVINFKTVNGFYVLESNFFKSEF
ncbi:hypothetical protein LEP1GSC109_3378 [Leptospira interrogans str. UI 13372]|nr:hypothetical protein LEP1GSC109_3378 [Leptospira interrogans str. UI 13372]